MTADLDKAVWLGDVPLDRIVPNEYNPNEMTEVDFHALVENIRVYGFRGAITLRPLDASTWRIVDGEHRWKAMRELGYPSIPAFGQDIPDDHAMLSTISLNNIRGTHDPIGEARILVEVSKTIAPADIMTLAGMRPIEFAESMALLDVPEPPLIAATPNEDPPVNVTLTLYTAEHLAFHEALERAYGAAPDEDSIILVHENVGAYDAAMQRIQQLAKVQKRGDAMAMICKAFLSLPDEQITAMFPPPEPKKKKKAQ